MSRQTHSEPVPGAALLFFSARNTVIACQKTSEDLRTCLSCRRNTRSCPQVVHGHSLKAPDAMATHLAQETSTSSAPGLRSSRSQAANLGLRNEFLRHPFISIAVHCVFFLLPKLHCFSSSSMPWPSIRLKGSFINFKALASALAARHDSVAA